MKKAISLLLTVILSLTLVFSFSVNAVEVTKEDYKSNYASYKTLYNDVYVPAYNAYNAKLAELAKTIKNTTYETVDEFNKIKDFLQELKTQRADFFGTRETPGKSRYVVPFLRNTMYEKYEAKDYASANDYCNQLKNSVQLRIDFLGGLSKKIDDFINTPIVPPTQETDATVEFIADQIWSNNSFGFRIILTNKSNQPVSNWNLTFNFKKTCSINTLWVNSSALNYNSGTGKISISPANKFQGCYTIPANSSIIIEGNANGNAMSGNATNATFNGESVDISYTAIKH